MTNIWKEKLSRDGILDVAAAKFEANQIFDRGFMSITMNFTSIRSFRKVIARGIPAIAPALQKEDLKFLTTLLQSQQAQRYFGDPQKILSEKKHIEFAQTITATNINTTTNATDAASIIFGHSVLDAAIFDFCVACAIVAPFDWLRFIGSRKVSLDDINEQPKLNLLGDVLANALKELERESLLKKADRLYAICQPSEGHQGVQNYTFDRGRLEQIDTIRHEIVHRLKIKDPIKDCDDTLNYLELTGLHLMSLPNYKYDLKLPSLGTHEDGSS